MASLRHQVLLKIAGNTQIPSSTIEKEVGHDFGTHTFNDQVMRERLPKDVYRKLVMTIKSGNKLDLSIANSVAHAMKEWAISKGATHFTHWFQPQTGLTAEKHDTFLEYEEGSVIERFRGSQLVQGEPDASSFPSGGLRTTFEARGYTMWDPSSPAFIMSGPRGGILCIPSVFISYTGEALDKKTPLLRSMESINRSALKILRLFGNDSVTRVVTTIGTEQEYFLVDKAFYNLRPDLRITGRTLVGAEPPKGQQMEDHYFGSIKERVMAFMQDAEEELYRLGVPAKTRHNEVAPHQYEIAPIYAEANVGADRNHLIMEVLKKIANRHMLALLLHEKPFAGVNGSGKHNNWSMEDSEGNNLLDPGKTPEENVQFLVFLVATIRAVHLYGDLLRATIASASNDHRLGANEAPPAIMSVFLGERLTDILQDIKSGRQSKASEEFIIDLGISQLPLIMRDNTDRNRTSPFAFTGSKFEFRAVGSSASVSLANTMLSAAVAESIDVLHDDIKQTMAKGTELKEAVLAVLRKHIKSHEKVLFEGNNYSKEWEQEAEKRGLPNIKRTAQALDALVADKNVKMLDAQHVFKENELQARFHTKLEQYAETLKIEALTFENIVRTMIMPAALEYQSKLIAVVKENRKLLGEKAAEAEFATLQTISKELQQLIIQTEKLAKAVQKAEKLELNQKARFYADKVVDQMTKARTHADILEQWIDDQLWPLPKYQEMLFIM
ncbi:glutamine synthetase type III [candidate division KSB1 bacterium]|nr:glutamine synthetase type III [candidate division KSB1 bacterium]